MDDARSPNPSRALAIATAAIAASIFVADTITTLEISFSSFYVVIVLLAARFSRPRGVVLVTCGCLILTMLSYALTPPGGSSVGGVANTAISIGTIVLTAFLTLKDKTREALRQELAKRAAELEAANKELESFAYSVSHDLRAPLRHIIGFAELLQKQAAAALDEKAQRYVRTIQDSARRMGTLIDDLLGFSRMGRAETRKVAVSLEQIVREAIAELAPEIGGRDIAWKIGALPTCYGDRSMLKLALQNLIANAVKFTRTRAHAEIEIGRSEKPNEVVVFVRDNGVGFDMRYADKLFGVFQRLYQAQEFEGTGIGLATVQRIVHRHGGEVRAEGVPDRGATFYITLPQLKV
jgi:signal transduction histidine kinase